MKKIKIGFHHTYPKNTKELILKLKPKVIRTYFEAKDIRLAIDIGAEPYVDVKPFNLLSEKADSKYVGKEGDKTNPPKSWNAWKDYVKNKIKEFHSQGLYPKYYEIWNEPDRTKPPIFWKGTMEEYFMLYKYAYLGIREVDKDALVGGPEICHFNRDWIKGLIDFCVKEKIELNFVSFHDFDKLGDLPKNVKLVRKWISKHPSLKFNGEINIGEWGFRIEDPTEAQKRIDYAEKAGVNFYCKDFFYDEKWQGSLLTKDFKPKPIYFSFLEYAKSNL